MENEKILKWCGWACDRPYKKYKRSGNTYWVDPVWRYGGVAKGDLVVFPNACFYKNGVILLNYEPPLDMNFFFGYVYPKLKSANFDGRYVILDKIVKSHISESHIGEDDDPNLAWQEALLKLINKEQDYG